MRISPVLLTILSLATPAWAADEASQFCLNLGGSLESVTAQDASCVIDEWALYRSMPGHSAWSADDEMLPNPAAINCDKIGGTLRQAQNPEGEYGLCVIDDWTLYRAIHPQSS